MEYDTVCDFKPSWRNVVNGQTYTANGITRTYNLSVDQVNIQFDSVNDPTATANTKWDGGTYRCPKSYHLTLKVFYHTTTPDPYTACDSFRWSRHPDTLYTYSMTSLNPLVTDSNIYRWQPEFDDGRGNKWKGCWDTIWLNLRIDSSSYAVDSVAACRFYRWRNDSVYSYDEGNVSGAGTSSDPHYTFYGGSFTTSKPLYGEIRDTMRGVNTSGAYRQPHSSASGNSKGCDSIISLWLKVYPTDTLFDTNVIACGRYTWTPSGKTYYSGGNQREHRDTVRYGTLWPNTNITNVPSYAGDTYHSNNGGDYRQGRFSCDSMYVLYLQIDSNYTKSSSGTSCDSVQLIGRPWSNRLDSV
ncbi:MAG: hypothetical protein IJ620_03750, partial [Bacteroidales bacterium]|nr:hypothetical protein [Bacteroidales bacterium]